METFGSPILEDVAFNQDGSLKQSGKQNVKFYNKKVLSFKAKKDADGQVVIDPKTGIPFKEAFEELKTMVRVETKGDTNIKDDIADDFIKRQFYRQYKFFREGKIPDGNPIEDFEFLQPNTIMELHMMGIHVIQQVAIMDDLVCDQLKDQSGYEIRDISAQWVRINSPQGQAGKASKLELEVARLKGELEALRTRSHLSVQPLGVLPEEAIEAEEPLNTMELTPEQMAKGPGKRKRIV